jgi:hypothetical protein
METAPPRAASAGAAWGRRLALAVAIVLVVLLAYALARRAAAGPDHFAIEHTRPVVSHVDGLRYRVHTDHAGSQRAADLLAALNARITELLRSLRARYVRGAAGALHPARRAAVVRLLARYNPDNLAENSPEDPTGDSSYSLDKGAVVAMCLRERGAGGGLHDLDTLTFVALHEMAHLAVDAVDHPGEFWSAFRFLLLEAEGAGIYRSPDYARAPIRYCGVPVDYNPRYDGTASSL